jgi:acetyltransferase-like isoleucine patch superfamily enzyme
MVARNCTTIGLPNITLGDRVRIEGFTSIIAAGGTVRIGSHVHIATACMLGARGGIEIGDFASLSQGARIFTAIDDFSGRRLSNATVPADLDARAERACSRSAVMSRSVPVRSSCRGWNSASALRSGRCRWSPSHCRHGQSVCAIRLDPRANVHAICWRSNRRSVPTG